MSEVGDRLDYLVARHGGKAEAFLKRVAARHQRLGFGNLAANKQKLHRWKTGTRPDIPTQFALADLLNFPRHDVVELGWPAWLHRAVPDALLAPHRATPTALKAPRKAGDTVERRRFMITAAASGMALALAPVAPATASTGRRVGDGLAALHEQRLIALRHLDDKVGSGHVYNAAVNEFDMIAGALRTTSYSEATGRRLLAAAADAQRAAGWTAYDSGHPDLAEGHFADAAEDALESLDPEVLATTLSFWAIKLYSTGEPQEAASLVEAAKVHGRATGSARMLAMLHARACRAHARAGDRRASDREANAALDAYSHATPLADDLPSLYWVNLGEIYQLLGSSALNLGHPARALDHFQHAATAGLTELQENYDGDSFPRGAAIYEARTAEAHLELEAIEQAVAMAHLAVEHMGGVNSARGSTALADLRTRLRAHRGVPEVRDFLEFTA
ncbi:transcriptional regulator [Streptomyces acidiscabies]|uniref:Transcriptional regulator n=1 Tax=Streptomyces acidiscabies TaxID=42234 RepID=A0ABU4ME58_9ACTN|nr:transcriptional regulator [Streptomyces acidiscabies]MDX3025809.1 transcriptional regulator [Streptomyces acidiscabies]